MASTEVDASQKHSSAEINPAIIASKEAKQKKRLLGKAQTRITIASLVIDKLTLTSIVDNKTITQHYTAVDLGRFGDDNGLDTNQLGGEVLRRLLHELINIDKSNTIKDN